MGDGRSGGTPSSSGITLQRSMGLRLKVAVTRSDDQMLAVETSVAHVKSLVRPLPYSTSTLRL